MEAIIDIKQIDDAIARDTWTSRSPDGRKAKHEIVIGRPFQIPADENRDWVCPVSITGFTPGIVPAMGVGPVDALMNAMVLVRAFREEIGGEETRP